MIYLTVLIVFNRKIDDFSGGMDWVCPVDKTEDGFESEGYPPHYKHNQILFFPYELREEE